MSDVEVPWREIAAKIRPVHGKVVVLMHPMPEKLGGILMPDSMTRKTADVGTVVASDEKAVLIQGEWISPPPVGTVVVVHPEDGSVVEMDGQKLKSIGAYLAPQEWTPSRCDWFESIVAELSGGDMVRAYGDKIVIRLDDKPKEQSGILLPDAVQKWDADATVVSVGPLHKDCKPENRISVDMNLVTDACLEFTLGKDYQRMHVIFPEAVNFIYA